MEKMGKKRQRSADLNFFPTLYDYDKYFVIRGMRLIEADENYLLRY